MPTGNVELMRESWPQHLRIGTAGIKQNKETDEGDKKERVNMERSEVSTKLCIPKA